MKTLIILLICFQQLSAQKISLNGLRLNDTTIYFFCRGTKSKSGLAVQKFNFADSKITHVGIGFYDGRKLQIYNVSDEKKYENNALVVDSLQSFITKNTNYFSIWKCNNDLDEFQNAKTLLEAFTNRKITFDNQFLLENGGAYYCSEFCAEIIQKIDPIKYHFPPSETHLDEFSSKYLGRKTLKYFPVDFFQNGNSCYKVFEEQISVSE